MEDFTMVTGIPNTEYPSCNRNPNLWYEDCEYVEENQCRKCGIYFKDGSKYFKLCPKCRQEELDNIK